MGRMSFGSIWILGLMAALLAFAGCESDDDDDSNAASGSTEIGGNEGGTESGIQAFCSSSDNCSCDSSFSPTLCTFNGEFTEDMTWTSDVNYLITGGVFIGDDVNRTTLTIEPGTTIFGENELSILTIRRNSQIDAEGTADNPIVFTSSLEVGNRNRGDWGGLVINGNAPINSCGGTTPCTAEGEGDTGTYGGDNASDDSGTLKYIRVEFAGFQIDDDNELNGIAFQGVGSGTEVDFIHLHRPADDGIEFYGGNVNVKHILITGAGDDSIDWTEGWQGKAQYLAVEQYADEAGNGIEADNLKGDNDAEPRSRPVLSNVTLYGANNGEQFGMLVREGTAGEFHNMVIANFALSCINLDQEATFVNAGDVDSPSGDLAFQNVVVDCNNSYDFADGDPWSLEDWMAANGVNVAEADSGLSGFMTPDGAAWPQGEAPADSFFDNVDYIGAFGDTDWTAGWTAFPED